MEFRPPDATANPYLMSRHAHGRIDGIVNKIDRAKLGFGPFMANQRVPPAILRAIGRGPRCARVRQCWLQRDGVFPER
jgi:hypothetical protein